MRRLRNFLNRHVRRPLRTSNTAVALHEQMLLVSVHPRFQFVSKEFQQLRVILGQISRKIALAILQGGGEVDTEELDRAQRFLEEAFDKQRSSTFQEVQDYAVLPHLRKLSRSVERVVYDLRMDAEITANMSTGRLDESFESAFHPVRERHSLRLISVLRNNLTFRSVSFRHAIRLGAVAALSNALGDFLHVRRGYWVVMTVLVV
jgi:uncharacterized membrane protein YccC